MKALLSYSLASFTKQTRANNFHSLTWSFPSEEIPPSSKEDPSEADGTPSVHLRRRDLSWICLFLFLTPFRATNGQRASDRFQMKNAACPQNEMFAKKRSLMN